MNTVSNPRIVYFRTPIHCTHRVSRVLSFSPVVGIGLPQPLTRRRVAPPPPLVLGGGAHSLAREEVGESQFRREDRHCGTLYICTLWLCMSHTVIWCLKAFREMSLLDNWQGHENSLSKYVGKEKELFVLFSDWNYHPAQRTLFIFNIEFQALPFETGTRAFRFRKAPKEIHLNQKPTFFI